MVCRAPGTETTSPEHALPGSFSEVGALTVHLAAASKPGNLTMLGQPHLQLCLVPWLLLYFYTEDHWLTDGGTIRAEESLGAKFQAGPEHTAAEGCGLPGGTH